MDGKYDSAFHYGAARVKRSLLRAVLRPLVRWPARDQLEPGCTAIIGMCSRLPDVIEANVTCLRAVRWPELSRVIIAVDGPRGSLASDLEGRVLACLGDLPCEFHYYSGLQSFVAERLQLPYVYAWLSWAIALAHVRTESVLIHDYDALLLGNAIRARYDEFRRSGAVVQGVRWYKGNGLRDEDRLATTFEAFADVRWLRRFPPIRLFHQIGRLGERGVDFDILLELQACEAATEARTIVPMAESELTHPSQMIHQYTMFRRQPGEPLPCYSIPMIPFFAWIGGRAGALAAATDLLRRKPSNDVALLGDGVRVNLSQLRADHVDWLLKQMLQACLSLGVPPAKDLIEYGDELYRAAGVPAADRWHRHFLNDQRAWAASAADRAQSRTGAAGGLVAGGGGDGDGGGGAVTEPVPKMPTL